MPKHHAMKVYKGSGEKAPYTYALDWVQQSVSCCSHYIDKILEKKGGGEIKTTKTLEPLNHKSAAT
jgi:hypothetical protein